MASRPAAAWSWPPLWYNPPSASGSSGHRVYILGEQLIRQLLQPMTFHNVTGIDTMSVKEKTQNG